MQNPSFPATLDVLGSKMKYIDIIEHGAVFKVGSEDQITVRTAELKHPNKSFAFRIEYGGKSMVYASDTEGVEGGDTSLIEFAKDCDLLIHDAQYTQEEYIGMPKQGWGHSTPEMAIEVAHKANVKQLVLFHHDPHHGDAKLDEVEAEAQKLFANTVVAYEGLTVRL